MTKWLQQFHLISFYMVCLVSSERRIFKLQESNMFSLFKKVFYFCVLCVRLWTTGIYISVELKTGAILAEATLTRACLTSLQTQCLSVRFLSQEEDDPWAMMGKGRGPHKWQAQSAHVNEMRWWRGFGVTSHMFTEESGRVWVGWGLAPLTPCIATSLFHGWQGACQHRDGILSLSLIYDSQLLSTNSAASCTSDRPWRKRTKETKESRKREGKKDSNKWSGEWENEEQM